MRSSCALAAVAASALAAGAAAPAQGPWRESFQVNLANLATVGENRYLVLRPGCQLTLEGREGLKRIRLVVSVLDATKTVGGVETRVVEERETANGALSEVSRNYLAIDKATGDVYYFGEDVDVYENGKVAGHEGAWQHGMNNARFGLMMPGAPVVGLRFYQELAPRVAMDRAEILSLTERLTTPAGTFDNCLRTKETSALEPGSELKVYAPGIGLVKDGSLELVARTPGR
jgi:hypothetical protein